MTSPSRLDRSPLRALLPGLPASLLPFPRGKLIIIEGADGCGKQTQSRIIKDLLDERNYHEHAHVEGSEIPGSELRDVTSPRPETKLFSFPRYLHGKVGPMIGRHLRGELVLVDLDIAGPNDSETCASVEDALAFQCMMLADKYEAAPEIEAHLAAGGHVVCDRWWQSAYAYGTSDGLDGAWIIDAHRALPLADANFLLDVPLEVSTERRPGLRDRYERDLDKQQVVRRNYRELWALRDSWYRIDGRASVADVTSVIWRRIEALF